MDMWVHGHRAQGPELGTLLCDLSPTKPEFRRKEAPLHHSVPPAVHFIDRRPKLIYWAIFDSQRQKDCSMSREVFVELGQSLEEPPSPRPGASPLAEGAEATVAGISRP